MRMPLLDPATRLGSKEVPEVRRIHADHNPLRRLHLEVLIGGLFRARRELKEE
jgi:hypothetical protein